MSNATWLADVLRAAGCKVVEEPGWKTRGRGTLGDIKGVLVHHTGPGSSEGLKRLIKDGRSDLPGPLSQMFLDEDGTFYIIAAGRCNHAGKGKWQGVTAGNSQMLGIECKNAGDGKDIWEATQTEALAHGVAGILAHIHADPVMAAGHKEYALPKGRKIDPTFDMFQFRDHVEAVESGTTIGGVIPPATVNPVYSMLRKGSQGPDVKRLQKLLGITVDGAFGPNTEKAVIKFQQANGLKPDGLVGPKTWTALGVK